MLVAWFEAICLLELILFGFNSVNCVHANEMDLYNTKIATSDLRWEQYSTGGHGWEEVSTYDKTNTIIRSYQVGCEDNSTLTDNWIRSPFILKRGGNQFYMEIEFSITPCGPNPNGEETSSKCKETFNLFYYQAPTDVASSTFPPWHETPYKKIDTVAANKPNEINKKLFTLGPFQRQGFYIAVQDQGACMSLISLRIFYHYCPETNIALVNFPRTSAADEIASLVTVEGRCVANAVKANDEDLLYRCSSNGQWQIQTGMCYCNAGYEANSLQTECLPCNEATYKLYSGPWKCVKCPAYSGFIQQSGLGSLKVEQTSSSHNQCPCYPGYKRPPGEEISHPCLGRPSKPVLLHYSDLNATSISLQWKAPINSGESVEIFYSFSCESSMDEATEEVWSPCLSNVAYVAPTRGEKYFQNSVIITGLLPDKQYKITVFANNMAFSSKRDRNSSKSGSTITFRTEQAVPSVVGRMEIIDRSTSSFTLKWGKPVHLNGAFKSYEIEIVTADGKAVSKKTENRSFTFENLSENTEYQVHIRAQNSVGYGPYSSLLSVTTTSQQSPPEKERGGSKFSLILILSVGGILFILTSILVFQYCKTGKILCLQPSKKKRRRPTYDPVMYSQNSLLRKPLIVDLPPLQKPIYVEYPDPLAAIERMGRDIDPNLIKIEQKIGEGEFAEVCRAQVFMDLQYRDVAVKRLKPTASKKDELNFLREASTMAQFNHPNIIQLIAVVTKSQPVSIITEYMENHSLDRFLQRHPGKLTLLQLLKMLKGISSGMNYLSSIKYVHRDLAARNILVDSELNCKVSDFGLSRSFENNPHATYTTQVGKIAIRWTALESILYGKFTSASDVWSYGIVAWEVMSYGEKPYWEMSNDDVISNVQSGMRLPSPVDCPKALHNMMVSCWSLDPDVRPTFAQIARDLDIYLRQPDRLEFASSTQQSLTLQETAQILTSPNLGRAMDQGRVDTVEKWLELQRLSKYSEQFRERGIDDLEKVSNLTINDLKAIGIEVTLHINKLENGIRTLKRHLSTCTSTPGSSLRNSIASSVVVDTEPREATLV